MFRNILSIRSPWWFFLLCCGCFGISGGDPHISQVGESPTAASAPYCHVWGLEGAGGRGEV